MTKLYINTIKGNLVSDKKKIRGGLKLPDRIATSDYNELINKPQINLVTLIGNKTSEDLGLQDEIEDITEQDIDKIIYGG